MGLHDSAHQFLEDHAQRRPKETCPTCRQTIPGKDGSMVSRMYDDETGREAGMFDDGPDLFEYTLKNGHKVQEVVQTVVFSSGPMIFLALRDEEGKIFCKWPDGTMAL